MSDKNPYDANSPEWQLWENMQSSRLQASAFADDVTRYTQRAKEARKRAELYRVALEKLAQ